MIELLHKRTATDVDSDERPRAPVEIRVAGEVAEVDWSKRLITLLAMPYDQDADVVIAGRAVVESCAPGAFAGVERRANRVKVNRDHDYQRTVGRAVALHPSRSEGLVTELRITPNRNGSFPLGDETLALCEDRALEGSVGFAVMPGGERWLEGRSRRRLERVFLDHISLVPEGAYNAQVLDVRVAEPAVTATRAPTPNLDEVLSWFGRSP